MTSADGTPTTCTDRATSWITKCPGCGCPLHASGGTFCSETCERECVEAMPALARGEWQRDPAVDPERERNLAHARYLGADAALASVVDHATMSAYEARAYLSPNRTDDLHRYPAPELVGEAADALLYAVRFDMGIEVDDIPDDLAEAWREGCDSVWDDALTGVALRTLGTVGSATQVEQRLEATVGGMATMAGLR